ncbi:uncharacterized protein [Montipora foliosa]|uniref:uncharacterized protein n=1 Tax=Montipora foliosa TaxID=591990 RepID=UPI0035F1B382
MVAYGGLDEQWQADLLEELRLKWGLGRTKFLLVVLDVFSPQAMAQVMASKSGINVTGVFRRIVKARGQAPAKLQTNQKREFFNTTFQNYCRERGICHFFVNGVMKAAMVERFNRTLQEGLAVLKRHEPCLSLQKALVRFLKAYNARPHRRLGGLAPREITLANTRDFFAFKIACCKIWLFTVGTDVLLLNFESAIRKTLAQDKRYKMQTVEYYDHPMGHRETIPL